MHDFQLDAVGIVKEHGVVPRGVRVLLRAALDLDSLAAEPVRPLVDAPARAGLERQVVQADAVAVVWAVAPALGLAQAQRAAGAGEVPDRLAALAFHLAHAREPERAEQLRVERQASLDRGDDEVEMVDAG